MRATCTCGRQILAYRFWNGRYTPSRPNPDHDLCMKCWKAEQDRSREQVREELVA